jgi:hypothetical protein
MSLSGFPASGHVPQRKEASMAAVTDLATPAAAVSAGYSKTQLDRGTTVTPNLNQGQPARYLTRFEKLLLGAGSYGPAFCVIEGESPTSAAAADTQALAQLNAWRRHRYSGSAGRASGSSDSPSASGGTHQVDVT